MDSKVQPPQEENPAASEFCHNNKTNVKIRKVNNFILTKSNRKTKEK